MRPSDFDSLPSSPGELSGWHVREKTEDGYPLMGSSPAERAESAERSARIKARAMRNHPFVGDGRYCQQMGPVKISGDPVTTGVVSMRVQCGYPRDTHPAGGTGPGSPREDETPSHPDDEAGS